MNTEIDFNRAKALQTGMTKNGMHMADAAAVALALEFASGHPEFALRFGQFNQNNLNRTLDNLAADQTK